MRVETETEKIVAVLHEVVEDSQPPPRWGFDELRREGFSEEVLAALEGVTRLEGETCEDVIRRSLRMLRDLCSLSDAETKGTECEAPWVSPMISAAKAVNVVICWKR